MAGWLSRFLIRTNTCGQQSADFSNHELKTLPQVAEDLILKRLRFLTFMALAEPPQADLPLLCKSSQFLAGSWFLGQCCKLTSVASCTFHKCPCNVLVNSLAFLEAGCPSPKQALNNFFFTQIYLLACVKRFSKSHVSRQIQQPLPQPGSSKITRNYMLILSLATKFGLQSNVEADIRNLIPLHAYLPPTRGSDFSFFS